MHVLLDTNSFLWFIAGNDRLNINIRNIIADLDNDIFLSIVSLWEIAIKSNLGKLELLKPFDQLFPSQLDENDIKVLPIEIEHLSTLQTLSLHHRDPFDRLIIAQSIVENLPVISSDSSFQMYPIKVIW